VVGQAVGAGLVQVLAVADGGRQDGGAERMVVPVPVAGSPDPAVLGRCRVQMPECVGETVLCAERALEVVLEGDEERVVRPVVWFENALSHRSRQ
jgi:hypothetical protein